MVAFTSAEKAQTGASDPILTRLVEEDTVPWYRKSNLRLLYLLLFPTCMGIELTSGFDSQLINALQIVPSWIDYFDDPEGPIKGIIAASYSLGAILSLPFIGIVNDKFGRRWSIFGGSVIMVIGALIQGLSVNVAQYIIARLILGFGIPTCIVSASSLIGELSYPKERPVLTSLFNVSYFVGQLLAAGITFGTNSIMSNYAWRIPSWLQMVPSLVQITFIFFVPESPRWLITKERHEEAFKILAKYHAEGDRESPFVKAEFAQLQTTINIELEHSKKSMIDLVRTSGNRRRLLLSTMLGLFTQWSGNTLISYYLGDILEAIGQTDSVFKQKINVAIAATSLVSGTIASLLVKRFRRRVMYLACTCSLLIVYISWTISMKYAIDGKNSGELNAAAGGAVLFFIFAYSPAYNIGYNALTYTYMIEIWPYAERSRGIAYFQLWGRLANFFTTFVNPIGLENAGWRYLISYVVFLAYEIVFVYFMFPETFGRTLEELAFLFEDKALADKAVHAVEKAVGLNGERVCRYQSTHNPNMAQHRVFHGTIIHCLGLQDLEIIKNGLIVITPDGIISNLVKSIEPASVLAHLDTIGLSKRQCDVRFLERGQFLIPGFVDTHNHAPQWAQHWLEKHTFPNEARFSDPEYARRVYSGCIDGFLQQGITTASYYGSIHPEATNILADLCLEKGQRAFVGKCNMNREAPDYYRDATVETSVRETQQCLAHTRKIDPEGRLIKYVITPRFAITCEDDLLAGLGRIAKSNPDLPIQTHFNEAEQEISYTKKLFPKFENEVDLYDHFGLLSKRSILAHCCYMSNYELERFKELECGVAHCPISNMTVGGGFMAAPVREFLRRDIKVGLGTDSGGGFSSSMLDTMRQALVASNAREVMSQGKDKGLFVHEVFYLATLGGAQVCCLDENIGNFSVGKEFDALLIDSKGSVPGVMTMIEEHDTMDLMLDKFIMTGDDRNIKEVFVRGRQVK
ncbi:guanine deaminase [Xylaria bambusicola]|uniref:guanine deaminase n=1 Tax=Xylaria bambusicola TaxID=326684 RepID=UPI002007B5CC|nr:guanine deaminase [Xylaria bambusicola]KAI0521698.1 guanine deaminase [Xylaria bambusicola]